MSTTWNPDALSGMRLGTCILEEPLSIGGMGAVFLARQERPHRHVAVKVIHRQLANDPDAWKLFLARFQREADATASLDHCNRLSSTSSRWRRRSIMPIRRASFTAT